MGIAKLSDGGGLQIWVYSDGAKRWRMAYRFNAQQKTLAIGVYPAIGLKEARAARDAAVYTLHEARIVIENPVRPTTLSDLTLRCLTGRRPRRPCNGRRGNPDQLRRPPRH